MLYYSLGLSLPFPLFVFFRCGGNSRTLLDVNWSYQALVGIAYTNQRPTYSRERFANIVVLYS